MGPSVSICRTADNLEEPRDPGLPGVDLVPPLLTQQKQERTAVLAHCTCEVGGEDGLVGELSSHRRGMGTSLFSPQTFLLV